MLQFNHLGIRRGAKLLFADASFNIHPGHKVGITGANGTGKSSLFALILGQLGADEGEFRMPESWVIAHVAQQTPDDERAAIEYVLDGDAELRHIQQQMQQAEQQDNGEQLALLHTQLDNIHGYQANSRAARLLHGLGFAPGQEQLPVNSFSGGWRMRLNLARALMCRSDLLLLDEPTNHLDLDAVIWLEGWLKNYTGTLLLISHDRDFLDSVCRQIAHIEHQQVTLYGGNYSAFEKVRAAKLANQQAEYVKQQREIDHIQSYINRFRAKATKARQAQSRIKALEKMQLIAPAHVDSPFHFGFREAEKYPDPLLSIEHGELGYAQHAVLKKVELSLRPGDRIGLLGPNGAGKSTLIKSLALQLPLLGGQMQPAQDLKIGYFAQHQVDQLQPQLSPLQHLQQLDPQATEQQLRNFLGGFGFSNDQALAPTAPFSGGEKARLALAQIVYQRPNLLLLDEPTNHLDIEMRQALAQALQEFNGAMLIVSHDRHLLRVSCDQLWIVMHGKVDDFNESLDDYPRWLAQQLAALENSEQSLTDNDNSAAARKQRKRQEAEQRKRLQPLQKKLRQTEQLISDLTRQHKQLEEQLADNDLYQEANKEQLRELLAEKQALYEQLEDNEYRWLEISEQLEQLSQAVSD
ncbi:MAG: ATP-binding cassette domain-containing protein [Chromatiales bacterium]|jgi:ATP-binding cassette subfamily F protein 3